MDFRHVTNLQTPYDDLDENLLKCLGENHKIGDPIPAQQVPGCVAPKPYADLLRDGIVGLYVSWEGLNDPLVAHLTGWGPPDLNEFNKLPLYKAPT